MRTYEVVRKLRYKYQKANNKQANEQLSKVLWYSFPTVYPEWSREMKQHVHKIDRYKARKHRWATYVLGMLSTFGEAYLLTLTFGDTYDSTTSETRRKYVTRWLNENTRDYFACLDVGEKNGREHYHAIVVPAFAPIKGTRKTKKGKAMTTYSIPNENVWEYGFTLLQCLKTDRQSVYQASGYVLKASGYASKYADVCASVRPFHARGVEHWQTLSSDTELPF